MNNTDRHTLALASASILLADGLRRSAKPDRAERMGRVVDLKLQELETIVRATPDLPAGDASQILRTQARQLDPVERRRLLVDLAFSDPFSPYEIKFDHAALLQELRGVASLMGEDDGIVDEIDETRRRAERSHRRRNWTRVGLIGLGTAVTLGLGGWLVAPAIATAIGSAAGLSGAAATAHGLALLGGGTLAAGGAGMAGGMWLVATAGAGVGLVGGAGGAMLVQLGAAEVRQELIKLQTGFSVAVLRTQADARAATEVIDGLRDRQSELESLLDMERELNDSNSKRVKSLEEKLADIATTIEWMEDERASATG